MASIFISHLVSPQLPRIVLLCPSHSLPCSRGREGGKGEIDSQFRAPNKDLYWASCTEEPVAGRMDGPPTTKGRRGCNNQRNCSLARSQKKNEDRLADFHIRRETSMAIPVSANRVSHSDVRVVVVSEPNERTFHNGTKPNSHFLPLAA